MRPGGNSMAPAPRTAPRPSPRPMPSGNINQNAGIPRPMPSARPIQTAGAEINGNSNFNNKFDATGMGGPAARPASAVSNVAGSLQNMNIRPRPNAPHITTPRPNVPVANNQLNSNIVNNANSIPIPAQGNVSGRPVPRPGMNPMMSAQPSNINAGPTVRPRTGPRPGATLMAPNNDLKGQENNLMNKPSVSISQNLHPNPRSSVPLGNNMNGVSVPGMIVPGRPQNGMPVAQLNQPPRAFSVAPPAGNLNPNLNSAPVMGIPNAPKGVNMMQPRPGQGPRMMGMRPSAPGARPHVPGQAPMQGQMHHGPVAGMGVQPGISQLLQLPHVELDQKCNCDEIYKAVTVKSFPSSSIVADQSSVPLGVVIQPLAQSEKPVPIVNFGNVGVVRCRKCRAYINPFVIWLDNGRKWQCNFCPTQNETPPNYYRHLDDKHQRVDKFEKPELSQGCIEIIAPNEYMVRPPMPPVFVFCFEMSRDAKLTGLLSTAIKAIRDSLDKLPARTQVGFIGFDEAIHFYNLRSDLKTPSVLTVPTLDELFIPLPEELLVNLSQSKEAVKNLLEALDHSVQNFVNSYNKTQEQQDQAAKMGYDKGVSLGSALDAAYKIMAHIGGRLNVFASKLTTLGEGKLTPRGANANILGTATEHTLLRPNTASGSPALKTEDGQVGLSYYKAKAHEFIRQQICCDLFVLPAPNGYVDLASISEISKFSGGDCHYFGNMPLQTANRKLKEEVTRVLTREMGWEAVIRVRATDGVSAKGFYGNFLLRGSDLMALPSVSADSGFAIEFQFDKGGNTEGPGVSMRRDLTGPITFQTALLYTNSEGERRIRILTTAIPTTKSVSEVVTSANLPPIVNIFGKKGVDIAATTGFDDFKRKLQNKCIEILRAHRMFNSNPNQGQTPGQQTPTMGLPPNAPPGTPNGQAQTQPSVHVDLILPPSLQGLPRYILGIMKSQAFRGGNEVSLDKRSAIWDIASRCGNRTSQLMYNPKLISLLSGEEMLPSVNNLKSDGIFLLNTGLELFLWVGQNVKSPILQDIFGTQTLRDAEETQLANFLETKISEQKSIENKNHREKVMSLILSERKAHAETPFLILNVVKEGIGYADHLFRTLLLDDRQSFNGGTMSYDEFLQFLLQQSQGGGYGMRR